MYSVWLSDDQQRVWRNYVAMTSRLQAAMNRQLQRDHGLSLADYDVLVALDEQPGCRISELGERLGWEQSRLSHQLSRMRTRELVTRRGADDDRRAATVGLTERGRAALDVAAPHHAELVREVVFAGMSVADLRAIERWTSRVLDRLDES
ncbi:MULTISPECIES: MarR family winged helix-turn-helix transcriptional regulator [unclassified Mycobacterium]|uniref:MarR family winged helix-turn-helix transcriptional regulator n=1 Tax=unclassified Mycobacterium TaxID=2642494 RepID=UPI0029C95A29|nr:MULTISPECIES: MarR family winged helix-turn-helix transcriptional regulator [unclassified Mycobacterium]